MPPTSSASDRSDRPLIPARDDGPARGDGSARDDRPAGEDGERGLAPDGEARLHPDVRMALATWPQIDPAVEAIVTQVHDADKLLRVQMRESLAQVGLTIEEFKVLMALQGGPRTHGSLCRQLDVSTGAMTNRLDKLEHEELVSRARDPRDRRGVLLSLTDAGGDRLEAYVDRGAQRERKLLEGLTLTDKRLLNDLLAKLLDSLREQPAS